MPNPFGFFIFGFGSGGDVAAAASISAPANLAAVLGQSGGDKIASLTWDAVVGATSYTISRKIGAGSWSTLDTSATNSYTDVDYAADVDEEKGYYRVTATDGASTSDPSNVAGACFLTTAGTGTFTFPVGATNAVLVGIGSGDNGSGFGGGGGGCTAVSMGTPSGSYDYIVPAAHDQDLTSAYFNGTYDGTPSQTILGVSNGYDNVGGFGDSVVPGAANYTGGNGQSGAGGAGGGAAGKTGNGSNGAAGTGGAAGSGGTLSGVGANTGGNAGTYGGGGADGRSGAGGCIAITWVQPA